MITESEMYWIIRLDHILSVVDGLTVVFALLLIFSMVAFIIISIWATIEAADSLGCARDPAEFEEVVKKTKRRFKVIPVFCIALVMMLVCLSAKMFIPTTKEWVAIKVIPAIANNEDITSIGKDLRDLAKDWIEQMKPEKVLVESKEQMKSENKPEGVSNGSK